VAAFKHYWPPTWSSAFYGSVMAIRYDVDVNTPTLGNVLGVPNYKELRAGANVVWTPVTASILVPSSCIPAASLTSRSVLSTTRSSALQGLPRFTSTSNVYKGRLRVQRAF
jgi:hypothetical protein